MVEKLAISEEVCDRTSDRKAMWAFSCKSGHGGQNFKYIRIKQIWSQMKAESLYFDNIKSKYKF